VGWRDDRQKAYACIRDTFEKGDILPSRQNIRQRFEQKSGIPPARAFRLSAIRGCVLRCRLTPAGGGTRPASERGLHRRSRFCERGRIVHHILSSGECQGLYRTGAIHATRGPFEWLSPIRGIRATHSAVQLVDDGRQWASHRGGSGGSLPGEEK